VRGLIGLSIFGLPNPVGVVCADKSIIAAMCVTVKRCGRSYCRRSSITTSGDLRYWGAANSGSPLFLHWKITSTPQQMGSPVVVMFVTRTSLLSDEQW